MTSFNDRSGLERYFKEYFPFPDEAFVLFTGEINPKKRESLWEEAKFIFTTPQGFENDVITSRINLKEVSLMIFDEAHRASGDYAYVFIAKQYMRKAAKPLILALTASPGSDTAKIKEVCKNLHIEEIELRTHEDPDVRPYMQDTEVEHLEVELPKEMKEVSKFLRNCFNEKLKEAHKLGKLPGKPENYNKVTLLRLQGQLQGRIAREKDYGLMRCMSLIAEALKVQHAMILIETQGLESTVAYMKKLQEQARTSKVKAVQNLVKDLNFRSAFIKSQSLLEKNIEHPKLKQLKKTIAKTLNQNKNAKIIVKSF